MSAIFESMTQLAADLNEMLAKTGKPIKEAGLKQFNWGNKLYTSNTYRYAHIEVLDVRDTKKMWIMHICIFPHLDDAAPIFGFDVICGANKITGIFHDFSITGDKEHSMVKWFQNQVKDLTWKKDRELPDWGKRIFSPDMIAAGNINTDEELQKIIDVAKANLAYYLENVGKQRYGVNMFAKEHDYYCTNQKQNEHTKRFLVNIGVAAQDINRFIDHYLFPEVGYEEL